MEIRLYEFQFLIIHSKDSSNQNLLKGDKTFCLVGKSQNLRKQRTQRFQEVPEIDQIPQDPPPPSIYKQEGEVRVTFKQAELLRRKTSRQAELRERRSEHLSYLEETFFPCVELLARYVISSRFSAFANCYPSLGQFC